MNNFKAGFNLRYKVIATTLSAYCVRSLLFLILLSLIAVYETVLNCNSHAEKLPLLAVTVSIFLNYLVYWFKIHALLLIPYIIFYILSHSLANFFYAFSAIVLLFIQIALVQYFNKSMVPLGADLFAYSFTDIKQTIGASGDVGLLSILFFITLLMVFIFVFIYFTKKIKIHQYLTLAITTFTIIFLVAGFNTINVILLKTEYARTLALNKSDFFATQSYHYFYPHQVETDIYSDNYSGDFGNESSAIQDFVYVDEEKYPFLHTDETPDVLSPFFNQSPRLPNIVIILVEGLGRSFSNEGAVLGNFTPFLDSLSQQSLYWKNFLSSAGRSFAVLPSVLGSLPFAKNGFNELGKNMPPHLSLVSIAGYNGYKSAFYYGGDSRFDNMNLFMKRNRVNNIYDESSFPASYSKLPSQNGFSWGYDDDNLFKRYLELSPSQNSQPQLNVLFTVAMHNPFLLNKPEKYERLFEERMNQLKFSSQTKIAYREYKRQYSSILFFDEALRTFITSYKQRSDFNNTIFIITGDHRMPEIPMISKMDRYHVPLLIFSPLLKRKATFSSVSSHFDIAPSLLAYLNNSYSFEKPSLGSWIGSGLDTSRFFVNNHQYPLMQTKNEVIDFIQGTFHLNAETAYAITDKMEEEPLQDKMKYEQLLYVFNRFKMRNQKLIQGAGLIPDSIYQKYYPH